MTISHEFECVRPYERAIPLLGLYVGEALGHGRNQIWMRGFFAMLFALVKTWNKRVDK